MNYDNNQEKPKELNIKNELFTINTNYNSSEINKVMKSSTNIFSYLSPLLTETLTSFRKTRNGNSFKTITSLPKKKLLLRNKNSINLFKPKNNNIYLKTQNNFGKTEDIPLLGPNNPPSLFDKDKLASFYKMSGDQKISLKSPEEKLLRDKLFEKYNIKKDRYSKYESINFNGYQTTTSNFFRQKIDNNTQLKMDIRYFKNFNKASKIIDINKQLVKRVNEMTNYFLLQKYSKKIEDDQIKKFYEKKMPKIHIRIQAKKPDFLKKAVDYEQNNNDEEPKKERRKKNTNKNVIFQGKNSLGSIKLNQFRKFAYNGLIEPEYIDDIQEIINLEPAKAEEDDENEKKNEQDKMKKLNKVERHYLSLIINKLFIAFKPNSRIDFSITKFGNKIYLFGGFSSKIYNELWTFNIDTNKWHQVKYKEKDEPTPRKGHTAIIIKNNIFIFGGEVPKDLPNEDLITYNILNNKFYYPKIPKKKKINPRKGHIMIGTNQTFMIQGGIDLRTLVLENSAYIYNIYDNYWDKLECIGKPLPHRAYHCATMVNSYLKNTLSSYTFYSLPDDISEENKSKIRYEGIYIFGGVNEKKIYCNDLYVIKIGKKPCINIKPKIAGKPPEPRINSKMLFLENYFFIIIHGGITMEQIFCDDIAVLNLENFNWIRPIIDDERGSENDLIGRIKHEIFFDSDKLYIFGGLGEENLLPLNFEIVEFEVTGFFNNFMLPGEEN